MLLTQLLHPFSFFTKEKLALPLDELRLIFAAESFFYKEVNFFPELCYKS